MSWGKSRSHRKIRTDENLAEDEHQHQLDHDGRTARKSMGKAQRLSPHTIRSVSTNEVPWRLSLVRACSLPTPPVDLAFHREPLTAAFDLHGLSTSHEWLTPHVRGGGRGGRKFWAGAPSPVCHACGFPPSARRQLRLNVRQPQILFIFIFATLAAMSYSRRQCEFRSFHPKLSDLLGADLATYSSDPSQP